MPQRVQQRDEEGKPQLQSEFEAILGDMRRCWGEGVKGEEERCGKLKWWEIGAREMAQRSRELAVVEGPGFNSQNSHRTLGGLWFQFWVIYCHLQASTGVMQSTYMHKAK